MTIGKAIEAMENKGMSPEEIANVLANDLKTAAAEEGIELNG
jgi:hypothetical protein